MTKLSVNINKIATLRNARGGNLPDLLKVASDCERFGAEGITVHPRPDERHIRYKDVYNLRPIVKTELNIEGYPTKQFMELVLSIKPEQVTLVPDAPDAITSDAGWDTITHKDFLKRIVSDLKNNGIRTSIFIDTNTVFIENAVATGVDRVELYTGPYAHNFYIEKENAIKEYIKSAELALRLGLGLNAGHDLNLDNLAYFKQHIPQLLEVSIGHALICDAIYFGLENTIQMYKTQLADI